MQDPFSKQEFECNPLTGRSGIKRFAEADLQVTERNNKNKTHGEPEVTLKQRAKKALISDQLGSLHQCLGRPDPHFILTAVEAPGWSRTVPPQLGAPLTDLRPGRRPPGSRLPGGSRRDPTRALRTSRAQPRAQVPAESRVVHANPPGPRQLPLSPPPEGPRPRLTRDETPAPTPGDRSTTPRRAPRVGPGKSRGPVHLRPPPGPRRRDRPGLSPQTRAHLRRGRGPRSTPRPRPSSSPAAGWPSPATSGRRPALAAWARKAAAAPSRFKR